MYITFPPVGRDGHPIYNNHNPPLLRALVFSQSLTSLILSLELGLLSRFTPHPLRFRASRNTSSIPLVEPS